MSDTLTYKALNVEDKMKLLAWLYPDVHAKLIERGDDNDD